MSLTIPYARTKKSVFSLIWDFLTGPHSSIQETGSALKARLLAALSLLLALACAALMLTTWDQNIIDGVFIKNILILSLTIAILVGYAFSRTKYFQVGTLITMGTFSAAAYLNTLIAGANLVTSALTFLPLIFLLGTVLLSGPGIIALAVLNFLAVGGVKMASPSVGWDQAGIVWGQVITMGIVLLIVSAIRNAIERGRVDEVKKVNKDLEDLSATLEQRVADRTRDIQLAAEIGRRISIVRDPVTALAEAVELIRQRFDLYYTQIYLLDAKGRSLELRAGSGEIGRELLRRSHRLPLDLSSINGTAAVERRPLIVDDTSRSLIFRPNPLLPETRSEMALPLVAGDRVLGVIDLQSRRPGALSQETLAVFNTLAGQLANALQTAELFNQVNETLQEVELRSRRDTRAGWAEFLDGIHERDWLGYQYDPSGVRPLAAPLSQARDAAMLSSPITVGGEQVGVFQLSGSRPWTEDDSQLVESVTAQVAQQIENLRLLEQSERYRAEAESAVRRLMKEEWSGYLDEQAGEAQGYIYSGDQVRPVASLPEAAAQPLKFDIKVREEQIGEFAVLGLDAVAPEDADLISAVSEQLGAHLENIRLYTTAQQELVERRRTEQMLSTQQSTLQALLDNMPVGVFMIDAETMRPLLSNQRAEQMLGRGISPHHVDEERPEVFPTFRAGTDDMYPMEELPTIAGLHGEFKMVDDMEVRQPDGSRVLLQVNGAPVYDNAGRLFASVVVFQDITDRKMAEETIAKRAAELATVSEVATTVSTILSPDEMLQTVVDLTKVSFGLYHAHIYLMNEAEDSLALAKGAGEIGRRMVAEGRQIPINVDKSLVARAARLRTGVIVNDVHLDAEFLPHPLLPFTCSEMAIPLVTGDRVLGVIDVQSEEVDHFTREDVSIMTTLAAQVAVSLQNARSFARAQRQAEREALINTISERIQSTSTVESALQVAVREIGRALGARQAAIRLGLERHRIGDPE